MTAFAVALVVLAACGYALGAQWQHGAVHDTVRDRDLGLRDQLRLVQHRRWLFGLAALGCGALLHSWALGLAPLSVVQPVGALALPITVLLNARQHGITTHVLEPRVVLAIVAATGGVGAFVLLAVGSATATSVAAEDALLATELAAATVLLLGVLGAATSGKVRCLAWAAGCAVAYGYVSLLMRAVVQQLGGGGLSNVRPALLIGVVTAAAIGFWLLQHAYADGPPDLVVACLTVVDPLVAVGLGIGLLGEADMVGPWTALGEFACACVACVGVCALARHHPQTQDRRAPTAVRGGGAVAGDPSRDRPDGSST